MSTGSTHHTAIPITPVFNHETAPDSIRASMINTGVWTSECPTPLDRLSLLTVSYHDFHGNVHTDGKMVVMDALAPRALRVFEGLYALKFPLGRLSLMDEFKANDNASMAANNSTAFCHREIAGGSKISMHAYGAAIDINPIQNPYISPDEKTVLPEEGKLYADRALKIKGMIDRNVQTLFERNGFYNYGGEWTKLKDYHHFAPPQNTPPLLLALPPEDAAACFDLIAKGGLENAFNLVSKTSEQWIKFYNEDKENFLKRFEENLRIKHAKPKDISIYSLM